MLYIIHFPILDLRPLVANSGKLLSPAWPMPDPIKNFIRHFGSVADRLNGGTEFWPGEDTYCHAAGILRFADNRLSAEKKNRVRVAYKRFYSDGRFVNRFEIGIVARRGEPVLQFDLEKAVKAISALPVRIKPRAGEPGNPVPLFRAGPLLAAAWAASSTAHKSIRDEIFNWVVPGEPMLYISYQQKEIARLPKNALKTTVSSSSCLYTEPPGIHYYKLGLQAKRVKSWLVCKPEGLDSGTGFERNLRINLSRLHTEKETIRLILNALKSKRVEFSYSSPEAMALEYYLKKQSEKIFKKTRYSIEQKNILDFALLNENEISAGSSQNMEVEIGQFENRYLKENMQKIINYNYMPTTNNNIITGDGNVQVNESVLINSYVSIQKNHGADTLKAIQLLEEHAKKSGDPDTVSAVKDLAAELEKKEPKKSLVKTIWTGITALLPLVKDIPAIADQIKHFF